MRITAGDMRGRIVPVADVAGLRPTPSKVRQAMFNILGTIDDFAVLDLFAGSGIIALEALSRGAATAISIELNHKTIHNLKQNSDLLKLGKRWLIQQTSVEKGLKALAGTTFDLIFADPPYAQGEAEKLPLLLDQYDIKLGQLIIEESARYAPVWSGGWFCKQSRRYGDTCLHFLIRR